jgi:hypothetical protein
VKAWNKYNLGDPAARDIPGFTKYLNPDKPPPGLQYRPTWDEAETKKIIDFVTTPRERPRLGASPLEMWWDGQGVPVGGPNPNGLRMRAVDKPTVGEGGVYLKVEGGKTKTGSTGEFRSRYGVAAENGIEVEIPQTRFEKAKDAKGVPYDDSAYPWSPEYQRRFDEEYVDRLQPPSVRWRAMRPVSPVSQENWEKYRHIFGYGDVPANFGY